MTGKDANEELRGLPAVHILVEKVESRFPDGAPAAIRLACRRVLDNTRAEILSGGKPPSGEELLELAGVELTK